MSDKEKMELTRKIGLFGLSDLRKLAPIGDLGYRRAIARRTITLCAANWAFVGP